MAQGKVKFFNQQKGFGFIAPKDGSKDLFFHFTSIKDNNKRIDEGDLVEFDSTRTDKGPAATNVRMV